jgi:hypothetical protein
LGINTRAVLMAFPAAAVLFLMLIGVSLRVDTRSHHHYCIPTLGVPCAARRRRFASLASPAD